MNVVGLDVLLSFMQHNSVLSVVDDAWLIGLPYKECLINLVYVLVNCMHPQLIYNRYFMGDKSALICFAANVILNRSY